MRIMFKWFSHTVFLHSTSFNRFLHLIWWSNLWVAIFRHFDHHFLYSFPFLFLFFLDSFIYSLKKNFSRLVGNFCCWCWMLLLDGCARSVMKTPIWEQFFVLVFVIEAILKLTALGPVQYFRDEWNTFDFIVTAFGVIELGLENVQGLSVLRAFRLVSGCALLSFFFCLCVFFFFRSFRHQCIDCLSVVSFRTWSFFRSVCVWLRFQRTRRVTYTATVLLL